MDNLNPLLCATEQFSIHTSISSEIEDYSYILFT